MSELRPNLGDVMPSGLARELEGERLQGVTDEDRSPLVISLPNRRLAAPQFVVVHRGKVVVDEGIAMDAFERGGCRKCRVTRHAEKPGALENQERPEPLAAGEHGMAKRVSEARGRPIGLLFRQAFREKTFDGRCGIAKLAKKL